MDVVRARLHARRLARGGPDDDDEDDEDDAGEGAGEDEDDVGDDDDDEDEPDAARAGTSAWKRGPTRVVVFAVRNLRFAATRALVR